MTALMAAILTLFILFHAATAALVARRIGRQPSSAASTKSQHTDVIVPVAGLPLTDAAAAHSALRLAHPGVAVLYCAFEETEPLVAPLRAAIVAGPEKNARLLIGRTRITRNPKLDNIEKALEASHAGFVMLLDGNVDAESDLVDRAMALFGPQTGLVSGISVATEPRGFASLVECAVLNTLYARLLLAADELGFGFAQGKMLLLKREIVTRAGGWAALAEDTAEDTSATKMAHRLGLEVRLLSRPLAHPIGRRTLRDVWARHLRWSQLRRESYPAIHAVEVLKTPAIPAALAAILAARMELPPAAAASGLLFTWYAIEAALARSARWSWSIASFPACLVRDVLLLAIWPAAFFKRGYVWRSQTVGAGIRRDSARP